MELLWHPIRYKSPSHEIGCHGVSRLGVGTELKVIPTPPDARGFSLGKQFARGMLTYWLRKLHLLGETSFLEIALVYIACIFFY